MKTGTPDPKVPRPRSIGEARRLIIATFDSQPFGGWDERERQSYYADLGVEGLESADDVRKIIAKLEESGMILFAN